MTGFLERIMQLPKKTTKRSISEDAVPNKVLQLQMAKEILAETFGISVRDVEEMIRTRCRKRDPWPKYLWIEG